MPTKLSGLPTNLSPALADYLVGIQTSGPTDVKVTVQTLINLFGANAFNPYKCGVYRTAAFSSTGASGGTVVQFDTEDYDTSNNMDVVTNKGRFTAPVNGTYRVKITIALNPASGNSWIACLFKNGTAFYDGSRIQAPNTGPLSVTLSEDIQLVAGDYIEAAVRTDYGGVFSYLVGTPPRPTHMSVSYLGT